jgi:hypothetical protein
MSDRTADGHVIEIGGAYWNNNLTRVKVTGVSHDETWDSGRVVRWYTTEGIDPPYRRTIFDGSRLAKRHPGTREQA